VLVAYSYTPKLRKMTNELNNLMPAQEKLEWVTPKISLMEAGETDGTKWGTPVEHNVNPQIGPS